MRRRRQGREVNVEGRTPWNNRLDGAREKGQMAKNARFPVACLFRDGGGEAGGWGRGRDRGLLGFSKVGN